MGCASNGPLNRLMPPRVDERRKRSRSESGAHGRDAHRGRCPQGFRQRRTAYSGIAEFFKTAAEMFQIFRNASCCFRGHLAGLLHLPPTLLSKRPQNGAWIADSHGRSLANSEGRDRPFAG